MEDKKKKALDLDAQELPIAASCAYEECIISSCADLEVYINLSVLYFVCTDLGYAAYHNLPSAFVTRAGDRAFELLDEAELKFGKHPEIDFWRNYFKFAMLGGQSFKSKCENIVESGVTQVPYFYLFAICKDNKYFKQAAKLFNAVKHRRTEKDRYIFSILKPALETLNPQGEIDI